MRACTVLLLLASACDQGSTRSELTILLIDGQADNPVVDVDEGELRVRVRQGEGDVQEATARIADGTFDLEVPITATTARTAIQARIDTSRGRVLLGAPPVFAPYGVGVGIARIVMGAPGSCVALDFDGTLAARRVRLTEHRASSSIVAWDSLALMAGGLDEDGMNADGVDFLDRVAWDAVALEGALEGPLGSTRGFALARDRVFFTGSARSVAFAPRDTDEVPIETPVPLHPAGPTSAIVDLGADGAAVLGGLTDQVSWLTTQGALRAPATRLATPRRDAVGIALEDGSVLVLGGNAEGTPAAERLELGRDGQALSLSLPPLRGGALLRDPSSESILWIGFEDAAGAPSSTTHVIRGCPSACAVEPGPVWASPRREAAFTHAGGALWILGGEALGVPVGTVERVRFVSGTPVIDPQIGLQTARASAAAMEHAFGIVLVTGGRVTPDPDAPLAARTIELCYPPDLDPL